MPAQPDADDAAFEARLDPELLAALPLIPLLDLSDIPAARSERLALAAAARARTSVDRQVRARDVMISCEGGEKVRVRHYSPRSAEPGRRACLVWLHGGGHVLGTIDQDDPLAETVVTGVGCDMVSVDWRRSPEHPFPAAIEDGWAALEWTFANAKTLGLDPARIAIGGSSSGGGLAAGLALLARDRGRCNPCFQWLFYPMLDDRQITASSRAIHHSKLWNRASNTQGWRAYVGHLASRDVPPYAAPSRVTTLTGLPPAFLATAELDLFVDENVDYAKRLIGAGIPCELIVYPGAMHGFDLFAPDAAVSKRFARDRLDALRRALTG